MVIYSAMNAACSTLNNSCSPLNAAYSAWNSFSYIWETVYSSLKKNYHKCFIKNRDIKVGDDIKILKIKALN
jgi:hypothetical protein